MKKTFIGLLIIAAAGAGIFLYLQKKSNTVTTAEIRKELLIGKWQVESFQPVKDSLQAKFRCAFSPDGLFLRSAGDSVKTDSLHYEWKNKNELVVKENDSTSISYVITRLTPDSLQWQTPDSVQTLLIKLK
ncbi:MAG: hypothetical protein J0L56_05815 [Chitinophagales bacterium]|nr:hypothetical protein [Chitinophagales bacterium]